MTPYPNLPDDADDFGTWSEEIHSGAARSFQAQMGFRATPWDLDENLPAPMFRHLETDRRDNVWISRTIRLITLAVLLILAAAYVTRQWKLGTENYGAEMRRQQVEVERHAVSAEAPK